jgi:hypothetical protein
VEDLNAECKGIERKKITLKKELESYRRINILKKIFSYKHF